jgi:hypothetical protein
MSDSPTIDTVLAAHGLAWKVEVRPNVFDTYAECKGITIGGLILALSNPNMDNGKWEADHWQVRLIKTSRDGLSTYFDTFYSAGIGHRRIPFHRCVSGEGASIYRSMFRKHFGRLPTKAACAVTPPPTTIKTVYDREFSNCWVATRPTLASILECLHSDALTLNENEGFETWAESLGFDSDSRKAEKAYNMAVDQTNRLYKFLAEGRTQNYCEFIQLDGDLT